MRFSPRGALKVSRVVKVVFLLLASLQLVMAQPVFGATPTLDCGAGVCPVPVIGTVGVGGTGTVTNTLSTTNANDLIIAIVSANAADTFALPTVGGTNMQGPQCSNSVTGSKVSIFYLLSATALASSTVSETVTGTHNDVITLLSFGINNVPASSFFDGACGVGSGTATNPAPSATVSSLAYDNDFILAGVSGFGSAITATSSTAPTTDIANSIAANAKTAVDSGYQTGTTGTSSYTLSFSITGTSVAWNELVVAVKSSTPSAVPLFPDGLGPVLLTIPILYYLFRFRVRQRLTR